MYNNKYNVEIANKLKRNNKKQITRQEKADAMGDTSFTSHLESAALKDKNITGGSGYAAATVRDMGYEEEKTNGAVGSGAAVEVKPKRTRKPKQEGGAILGLADIQTVPRGDEPITAPLEKTAPSASKMNTQTKRRSKSEMPSTRGGAKPRQPNKYALLVKEIMGKQNLKMIEASKYIKEHNLYKKD